MTVHITRGATQKPVSSERLSEVLSEQDRVSGELFIAYPIIGTPEGPYTFDALFVTKEKGIIVFNLMEELKPENYQEQEDIAANYLESQLKRHLELMKGRKLMVQYNTLSFVPTESSLDPVPNNSLVNINTLLDKIMNLSDDQYPEVRKKVLSVVENVSQIRKTKQPRNAQNENSRGAKLGKLENQIALLDNGQNRAVIETAHDVQRIRGLAGSGKTIVLALKAAYLHTQNPDWRIAVTFYTRSLKDHFKELISRFVIEKTGYEPDWDNLRVLQSWGSISSGDKPNGIYAEFCQAYDLEILDYRSARSRFGREESFSGACSEALKGLNEDIPLYDIILVDEAQDLPISFLQLCYRLLGKEKRLVYAYDELQKLSGESLPPPEEIFGNGPDGLPNVTLDDSNINHPQRDIILEKCYRNSRPALVTAHALGFGIYREQQDKAGTNLIQMFDHPQLWEEIGYKVEGGTLQEGSHVTLSRNDETSPEFLENHSEIDDLVQFKIFDDEIAQIKYLVESLVSDIRNEELKRDDIIVINPDPLTTTKKMDIFRLHLLKSGINSHLVGVETSPDAFFQEGSIAFTGIYRAKGNEAGMVYIINAQDCHTEHIDLARKRNRLFTAITRSKAWVRVLGIGPNMEKLMEEYQKLRENNFRLNFKYPTASDREQIQILHRDSTTSERNKAKSEQKHIDGFISSLEKGKIHLEDLDQGSINNLLDLLKNQ